MLRPRAMAVVVGLALAGLAAAPLAGPAVGAAPTFGAPTVDVSFGQAITFSQPVSLDASPSRVELLLSFPGSSGPHVIEVAPLPGAGSATLRHRYEAPAGELTPNTRIVARWRLTAVDASETIGPPVEALYADDRFAWRSRTDGLVRLHWYEGDDAFAERAIEVAVDGLAAAQAFMGVTESEPIDFFVYASEGAIYEALAPDRENVGGQAYPAIRTLFALIRPSEIDDPWIGIVIPHEIAHLVFDTAVANDYGYPPKWLNEGVAVYLSEGYSPSHRASVEWAVADGTLIPLDGLAGQFPTTVDRFGLAYSESVSAVDFLARTHGEEALRALIDGYGAGRGEEEVFGEVLGSSPAAFDLAWRADLGADEPLLYGPRAGEPGPVPDGWDGAVAPSVVPDPVEVEGEGPAAIGQGTPLVVAAALFAVAIVATLAFHLRRRAGGSAA